jgi:hypothetical protein
MKDLTLDEMLEIAAQREAANEALLKRQEEDSGGTLGEPSPETPTDPPDALQYGNTSKGDHDGS